MLFDDYTVSPIDIDAEEERRRQLLGVTEYLPSRNLMAASNASPGIVAAAQPQDDAVNKAKSIIAGLGLGDQLPGFSASVSPQLDSMAAAKARIVAERNGDVYNPPLNSMKPDAIVPLPTTPMPGASTDIFRPFLNSMKPGAVVPLPETVIPGASGDAGSVDRNAANRPALWANVAGPAAPGQRTSDWKNYGNGVMINDGVGMPSAPTGTTPGAGYTYNGADGIKPIAAPGDMDWGNRLAQEPYTNPLIQGMIRDHQMQMERQKAVLDNHLMVAQENNSGRNQHNSDMERNKGLAVSGNPKIAPEVRKGAIESLKLPEQEKAPMRIEVDLTTSDPKGNPQAIGVGKDGSFKEIMTRAGSHDPQALRSYLESQRGVGADVAAQRINILQSKGIAGLMNPNGQTQNDKKEIEFIKKLYGSDLEWKEPSWVDQLFRGKQSGEYVPKVR